MGGNHQPVLRDDLRAVILDGKCALGSRMEIDAIALLRNLGRRSPTARGHRVSIRASVASTLSAIFRRPLITAKHAARPCSDPIDTLRMLDDRQGEREK
jgi:hypothetical protein